MIQKGKKKALIIGISDYQDDNLENLDFCTNDVTAIYEVLQKNGYDIQEDKVLKGEVDYDTMKKAIISFFRDENIHSDDTLLFYFSGHGVLDGFGGRFFANTQINSKLPEEYGIPFSFLTEQMKKSNSFKKVAILDCCFSGDALAPIIGKSGSKGEKEAEKLGREALSKEFEGSEGNCILASSLSQELSYKLPDKPFSAFSYYVIEGLKGAEGAYDENFCVTPLNLSQYVFSQLKKLHGLIQKPICNMSVAGKIVLAELEKPKSGENKIDETKLTQQMKNIAAEVFAQMQQQPNMSQESKVVSPIIESIINPVNKEPVDVQLKSLLLHGKIREFNDLKKQHPDLILNLENFQFSPVVLTGINLSRAILRGCKLAIKSVGTLGVIASLQNSDLSGADLSGAKLNNIDLSNSILNETNLNDVDLSGADLSGADMTSAKLNNANLSYANLSGVNGIATDFSGVNLLGATLSSANLMYSKLKNATFGGTRLANSNLSRADLSNIKLDRDGGGLIVKGIALKLTEGLSEGAVLYATAGDVIKGNEDFTYIDLSNAKLQEADLSGSDLQFVDLSGADLSGAALIRTNLKYANLKGANLTGANATGADLRDATLDDAYIDFINLDDAKLKGANLKKARKRNK